MTDENADQMRGFIMLAETLIEDGSQVMTEVTPPDVEEPTTNVILVDLSDLVFKLRAFMETSGGGDYALGVEDGFQRAADMVENLIRRHTEGQNLG